MDEAPKTGPRDASDDSRKSNVAALAVFFVIAAGLAGAALYYVVAM